MSQFHISHGRGVATSEDGLSGWLSSNWLYSQVGSNWLYSKRDVKENEIVCIRVTEMSEKQTKKPLLLGFTDEDPVNMGIRPKASLHLCNNPLFVPPSELRVGALLVVIYDLVDRLVFLGVDGKLKAVTTLWGLRDSPRWLALRIDGPVTAVQMHESPDQQWSAFVLECTRVAKVLQNQRFFNCGASGLQKPLLTFLDTNRDPRVTFSQKNRQAVIEGVPKKSVVIYTSRPVLLNELVSLCVSGVSYGASLEIFTVAEDPSYQNSNVRSSDCISIRLTRDDTVHLTCTEKGLLIQGRGSYVQSSSRFYPIAPAWIGFKVTSPASFITLLFEDPHRLPPQSSIRDSGRMVVRNRAYSNTKREQSLLCKVCYVNRMDTVLSPCYHISMCADCTKTVMDKLDWCCPICKEVVDGFFKVKAV